MAMNAAIMTLPKRHGSENWRELGSMTIVVRSAHSLPNPSYGCEVKT